MTAPVILWLRRDLRLADQPALAAAVESDAPVIPVYILDDETPKHRKMGGASRWWLHHSLVSLDADLRKVGSRLILRAGKSNEILCALAKETGASAIEAANTDSSGNKSNRKNTVPRPLVLVKAKPRSLALSRAPIAT